MPRETIEPAWLDAFEAARGRCGAQAGDTVAVLGESQRRPVLLALARLAAARRGAQVFSRLLPSNFSPDLPVARSTGASPVPRQLSPVVAALAGSTLVVSRIRPRTNACACMLRIARSWKAPTTSPAWPSAPAAARA